MSVYEKLRIPTACRMEKTIYKKLFYENGELSASDKNLFADALDKVTWLYCLKPETSNIPPYRDELRDYAELEIIEAALHQNKGMRRIAEIMMRCIPYPMLLVFRHEGRLQLWTAHQRVNQNDQTRNTLEDFVATEWLSEDTSLLDELDIRRFRMSNYFTLYTDIIDAVSVFCAQRVTGGSTALSGEDARVLLARAEELDRQIISLRAALRGETQFNRKMELNIQIKALEQQKKMILHAEDLHNDQNGR